MVNLETENVTAIHGLGFKNWSNFKLDASDRDNGKNCESILFLFLAFSSRKVLDLHCLKENLDDIDARD